MKIIFSHPTGNANVRAALKGINDSKKLDSFHTSIANFSGGILNFLSKIPTLSEIRRRQFDLALKPYTKTYLFKEVGRLLATKMRFSSLIKHETGCFSVDAVYQFIDRSVAKSLKKKKYQQAVYAYEDGALHSFTKAKELNIRCLYDLPIGYWRTARILLEEERNLRPTWACTLTGFKDSKNKLERKDAELVLADHIIVASSFTKQTLASFPGKLAPIIVIPYGFPPVIQERKYISLENRPLRLLFVGGLSQRKGIANILEAVSQLENKVQLTIVGKKVVEDCEPLNEGLKAHNYIPSLAHSAILKLMQEHDVFVFPSLFEGFGLVITEAMSQGTPVITTDRTAGPDLIQDGVNGWLVEPGSTQSLLNCIENLLANTHLIKKAGLAAIETARQRPWDKYSKELSSFIDENT